MRDCAVIMSGMHLHWRDIDDRTHPGKWDGLLLTVADRASGAFEVAMYPPMRCMRLSIADEPLLWAMVEAAHDGCAVLRAERRESLGVVPPIPFADIDGMGRHGMHGWLRGWAKYFALRLRDSLRSPLHTGLWMMQPMYGAGGMIPSIYVDAMLNPDRRLYVEWFGGDSGPLPLRDLSNPDDGRVKAWRKKAREGTLPPVLLLYISGLAEYVLLDGHDRLLAAHLEGVAVHGLRLSRVRELEFSNNANGDELMARLAKTKVYVRSSRHPVRIAGQIDLDKLNEMVLGKHVPMLLTERTLAMPLAGGYAQWESEVRAEAAAHGIDPKDLLEGEPWSERASG
jgi:hypothetical protein